MQEAAEDPPPGRTRGTRARAAKAKAPAMLAVETALPPGLPALRVPRGRKDRADGTSPCLQGRRQLRMRASSQLADDEPILDSQPGSARANNTEADMLEPPGLQVLLHGNIFSDGTLF